MFCIKCGKKAIAENFCKEHLLEGKKLFDVDVIGKIYFCDCGSYYIKRWEKIGKEPKEFVESFIRDKIKSRHKITKEIIDIKQIGTVFKIKITCKGLIKPYNLEKTETKILTIKLKKRKCDICTKLSGGYHEAVIQIRGKNKEKIMKDVKIPSTAVVEKTKDGYNIKFIKKSDARRVVNNAKFSEIKKSYKLVSSKKGKKLYRDFYSIR